MQGINHNLWSRELGFFVEFQFMSRLFWHQKFKTRQNLIKFYALKKFKDGDRFLIYFSSDLIYKSIKTSLHKSCSTWFSFNNYLFSSGTRLRQLQLFLREIFKNSSFFWIWFYIKIFAWIKNFRSWSGFALFWEEFERTKVKYLFWWTRSAQIQSSQSLIKKITKKNTL